jgi:hypothetical protein
MIGRFMGQIAILSLVSLIGYSMLYMICYAILIHKELEPDKSVLTIVGESLRYLLYFIVVYLVISIIMGFGATIGFFLLIIGMLVALLYFGTVFAPAGAIIIVEKSDPISVLGRCFSLVHKHFWPTVGQVAVFVVIYMIVSGILGMIAIIPFMGSLFDVMSDPMAAEDMVRSGEFMSQVVNPVQILLSSLANALTLPAFPVFSLAIYLNLKAREDQAA